MNTPDDPLEAELAALRPRDVSPVLGGRIGRSLGDPWRRRSGWLWRAALVGGLAAACLVAVPLVRWLGPARWTEPSVIGCPAAPTEPNEDSLPTVRVYQHALARSSEELDALFDRHAARDRRPEPRGAGVYAFPRSELEIRSLIGEP